MLLRELPYARLCLYEQKVTAPVTKYAFDVGDISTAKQYELYKNQ